MNRIKTFVTLLLCLILTVSALPFTVSAAGPKITVASVTAVPGDEIAIAIDISENTGVMAMTFALGYDTKVLTYTGFNIGIFNDYTIGEHPDKGYISFVNCENQDRTYEGNILVYKFTVNSDAPAGFSPLTILNIHPEEYGESLEGCFANWGKDVITPTIVNGGVTVGETCANSGHKYGDWKNVSAPLCETEGIDNRSCTRCGHTELKNVKAIGHDFEDKWTVDKVATAEENGKMSRHCKRCEETTDEVAFKADIPEKNEFQNSVGEEVKKDQWPVLESFDEKEESKPESTISSKPTQQNESIEDTSSESVTQENQKPTSNKKLLILLTSLLLLLAVIIVSIVIVIKRKK